MSGHCVFHYWHNATFGSVQLNACHTNEIGSIYNTVDIYTWMSILYWWELNLYWYGTKYWKYKLLGFQLWTVFLTCIVIFVKSFYQEIMKILKWQITKKWKKSRKKYVSVNRVCHLFLETLKSKPPQDCNVFISIIIEIFL